jgi:hypothetical protein
MLNVAWLGKTSELAFLFTFISDNTFATLENYEKKNPGKIDELFELYDAHQREWENNQLSLTPPQVEALNALITVFNNWQSKYRLFLSGLEAQEHQQNVVIIQLREKNSPDIDEYLAAIDWWDDAKNREILASDILFALQEHLGEDSFLFAHISESCDMGLYDDVCDMFFTIFNYFDDEVSNFNLGLIDTEGDLNLDESEFEETKKLLLSRKLLHEFFSATYRFDKVGVTGC